MNTPGRETTARWICRALALVFLAASLPKLIHPAEFAVAIYRYQMVPHPLINALAVFLPWLELVCALALGLRPALRRGALVLVLAMLAVFTAAIGINLYRGIDIACGCFSVQAGRGHLGWWSLLRNTALLAAAGWALGALRASPTPPVR